MRTDENQTNCPNCNQNISGDEVKITPKISKMLSPAQVQLLDYTHYLDAPDLVNALKLVHDVTIYHSHELLDEAEKDALFSVKGLWECIARIKE